MFKYTQRQNQKCHYQWEAKNLTLFLQIKVDSELVKEGAICV